MCLALRVALKDCLGHEASRLIDLDTLAIARQHRLVVAGKHRPPVCSVAQMSSVRIEPCVPFSQDLRPQTYGLRELPPFADPRGPQWSAVQMTLWAPYYSP